MDKILIFKHLKGHYNRLKAEGYNILFVALQGSQNYELDTENSDVDSIAIIIPSLDDICNNKKPISTTIVLDNNEHIDVKDIREIEHQFVKQNTHYLQILFTEYKIVNKQYREYINALYDMNENITHINRKLLIQNILGIANQCFYNFKDNNQTKKYNGKQLYHLIRLNSLFENLNNGLLYQDAIKTFDANIKETILNCKEKKYTYKQASKLNDEYHRRILNKVFDCNVKKVCEEHLEYKNQLHLLFKNIIEVSLKQDMQIIEPDINLEQYPNVYLTSDTHFGHSNIIQYEHRDIRMNISGVMEHDSKLIENWNKVVKPKDLVIILGDFSFHKPEETMNILKQLHGDKILIEGNHDCMFLKNKRFDRSLFKLITEYKEFHWHGYHICLMHYPIQSFKHMDKSTNPYIHLHGHIHSIPYEVPKHSYNVGTDVNNFTPIHIKDAIQKALTNNGNMINGNF